MEESLEGLVHLSGQRFPHVKFFEEEDVGLEDDEDGVCNDLIIGIWKYSDLLDFSTLLYAVEKHFRPVGGSHWAPEQGVVIK
jgi:hypothetical protein